MVVNDIWVDGTVVSVSIDVNKDASGSDLCTQNKLFIHRQIGETFCASLLLFFLYQNLFFLELLAPVLMLVKLLRLYPEWMELVSTSSSESSNALGYCAPGHVLLLLLQIELKLILSVVTSLILFLPLPGTRLKP